MAINVNALLDNFFIEVITVKTPQIREHYQAVGEEIQWRINTLKKSVVCPLDTVPNGTVNNFEPCIAKNLLLKVMLV